MRLGVALLAGLLAILHLTLHVGLGLGAVAPDLMTLGLLLFAREVGPGTAAGTGLLLGLLEDAVSPLSFGANAAALAVVGALGSGTRTLFVGDSPWFGLSYLFFGKWIRDLFHWVLVGEELREPFTRAVLIEATAASLYVMVVGVLFLSLFGLRWDTSGART